MKRTGPTSIVTRKLITRLEKAAKTSNARIWAAVAEILAKPTRRRPAVNISKINRYAREGEIVVVPGKVLGAGKLEKKVTVAALSFSKQALIKIKEAGGEAITIQELLERNPKGSGARIIV
ncbi:MAG: 50S ribosomal protein L18e [Desulfurococcales archaeon]|nr:50S ribosomal protein L18e [Desulfurococcales archaeon]